jgi:hypothetical protein
MVVVAVPFRFALAGLKAHPTDAGSPEQLKFTGPVNPFWGVAVIV